MGARLRIALPLLVVLAAALALTGCDIRDPYNDRAVTAPPQTATSERPGMAPSSPDDPPVPPQVDPGDLPATPRAAIAGYLALTGSWDWRTVEARYRAALPLTADAARADTILIAQQFAIDPRYRTERVRQHTTLEAVDQRGAERDGRIAFLVVTQRTIWIKDEEASSDWVIVDAAVRAFGGAWAVVQWDEQTT